jgi:hypothetical protein
MLLSSVCVIGVRLVLLHLLLAPYTAPVCTSSHVHAFMLSRISSSLQHMPAASKIQLQVELLKLLPPCCHAMQHDCLHELTRYVMHTIQVPISHYWLDALWLSQVNRPRKNQTIKLLWQLHWQHNQLLLLARIEHAEGSKNMQQEMNEGMVRGQWWHCSVVTPLLAGPECS